MPLSGGMRQLSRTLLVRATFSRTPSFLPRSLLASWRPTAHYSISLGHSHAGDLEGHAHTLEEEIERHMKEDARSVEEIYQRKTPQEHVLLRPDTYVGSVEHVNQPLWVYENGRMVHRTVSIVPGLHKIFDEILVNAADNKQRDPRMDTIRVDIDRSSGRVTVWNNGRGIPVVIHRTENVWVPELIFGHLLTSSNFDDSIRKVTGGRNGYGAKLCNIFSSEFHLHTSDGRRRKSFRQEFFCNMTARTEPVIADSTGDWTEVSFVPDYSRLGMTGLEDDIIALFTKRVYDVAGCCPGVKVYLNGELLSINNFGDYANMYFVDREDISRIHERANRRWEVILSPSDGQFQQVSFVNSICTVRGGTHVNYVTDQIVRRLHEYIERKFHRLNIRPFHIRNHMEIFINSLIENPAFDSQTKETLTSRVQDFGSKCLFSDAFMKRVIRSGIVENIVEFARYKQTSELRKLDGSKKLNLVGIPKLDDANEAGGRRASACTLIITEGDSAKSLAVSGLSVVGRDTYGVFPVRGKLLNVRDAGHEQILRNEEVNSIVRILGLQYEKEYESTENLRYGHVMVMTDQDHDGSHIKGLLINMLHHFWPSLLRIPGFFTEFVTPIVKASKGKQQRAFFTMSEFARWKSAEGAGKGWTIKYYKGLGTSTALEAKEYFSQLEKHKIDFVWSDEEDGALIDMAFSKHRTDERKKWLRHYDSDLFVDHNIKLLQYKDFIQKELIHFAMADTVRSIPSFVDGMKPSQRKILFSCFKRNLRSEVKVAQLSGYVSEHSAYHHGEASLQSTIVNMAQDFVGSNNINLLVPSGQFGTRLEGGKDAASPRYIFTQLSPITRYIFPEADDAILNYRDEDGQFVEPEWYVPIIPMVLVNGSDGIGTGWSSSVPCFNPKDLVVNIKNLLHGRALDPMTPWYRGFKGEIRFLPKSHNYETVGIVDKVNSTTLHVRELPINVWTQTYKEFLQHCTAKEYGRLTIKDFRENHTDNCVSFTITLSRAVLARLEEDGLLKALRLTSSLSRTNMHLFDVAGRVERFETQEDILMAFYPIRLQFYERRKESLLARLGEESRRLDNRLRFVEAVVNGELLLTRRSRAELIRDMQQRQFEPLGRHPKHKSNVSDTDAEAGTQQGGFEYLLSMPLSTLTRDKVEELRSERDKKQHEFCTLQQTSPTAMWEEDLDAFMDAWERMLTD